MPRPSAGYRNAAGTQVPGVHDITNAYCPKPALVQWAYNQGKKGVPLYEKSTLDIGTAVHEMAELDLKGASPREIEANLRELVFDPAAVAKARLAFEGFSRWRDQRAVSGIAHEVSLVSETHQFGGTPDCIAFVDGEIGLLDFKTCTKAPAKPYDEQLMAMAAHAMLWNEAHPDQLVWACHIIYLPKDGSAHRHHAYRDIARQWREFRHLLAAFAAKHGTPKPLDARDAEIARLRSELQASAAAEAGKTLRAFAPPRGEAPTQLTLDVEPSLFWPSGVLGEHLTPPANVVQLRPVAAAEDGIPAFLRRKPTAPSVKPRVRVRTDGSWFYVKK
jgi:hypothetical protein